MRLCGCVTFSQYPLRFLRPTAGRFAYVCLHRKKQPLYRCSSCSSCSSCRDRYKGWCCEEIEETSTGTNKADDRAHTATVAAAAAVAASVAVAQDADNDRSCRKKSRMFFVNSMRLRLSNDINETCRSVNS